MFEEFFKFLYKFVYKFKTIFQNTLMSTFLLNVPPELKFWRRHCSTELERNSYMKFCPMSLLNQNPGAALVR